MAISPMTLLQVDSSQFLPMYQSPNPASCFINQYGSFHVETSLGCPSAMSITERSPRRPRKKKSTFSWAWSLEIYGGCFGQSRNKAGKYDFLSVHYWCRRGFSRVWSPRNLSFIPPKEKGAGEENKFAHALQNQCPSALRAATLLHERTNATKKTRGNLHISTALLPAQNLQPELSSERIQGDLHKGTAKLKG